MAKENEGAFDIEIFNTDPKFENQRNQLDKMMESSLLRIAEKKKLESKPEENDGNVFDAIFGNLFGSKKEGQ